MTEKNTQHTAQATPNNTQQVMPPAEVQAIQEVIAVKLGAHWHHMCDIDSMRELLVSETHYYYVAIHDEMALVGFGTSNPRAFITLHTSESDAMRENRYTKKPPCRLIKIREAYQMPL